MDRLAVPARTLFLYGDEDPFFPPVFVAVIPASGRSSLRRARGPVQRDGALLPRQLL